MHAMECSLEYRGPPWTSMTFYGIFDVFHETENNDVCDSLYA